MKNWYLLTPETRPNLTGGFENDSFTDFKDDALYEAFETDLSSTVTLYDSCLNKIKDIKCIVQNNLANTLLKSMERIILAPVGTLKAGMYILYENRYWLITGYPGNNKIYEKATMYLCQYKLKWQKDDGTIVEKWANFTSASKYDVGVFENKTITLASNNFTILIPEDDDGITLDEKRVFIDRNINNMKKVFKITRSDDVLYLYGNEYGGILSFIADRTELNIETDRSDLGICDYIKINNENNENPNKEPTVSEISIIGLDKLKVGFEKTYTVSFQNDNIKEFSWNIVSGFKVITKIDGNKIKVLIEDEDLISSSFLLQVIIDNKVVSEKKITIVEGF